jgi:hypothetical protein
MQRLEGKLIYSPVSSDLVLINNGLLLILCKLRRFEAPSLELCGRILAFPVVGFLFAKNSDR